MVTDRSIRKVLGLVAATIATPAIVTTTTATHCIAVLFRPASDLRSLPNRSTSNPPRYKLNAPGFYSSYNLLHDSVLHCRRRPVRRISQSGFQPNRSAEP